MENVDKLALMRGIWYQVLDCRVVDGETEYKLYTRDSWVPRSWLEGFRERER